MTQNLILTVGNGPCVFFEINTFSFPQGIPISFPDFLFVSLLSHKHQNNSSIKLHVTAMLEKISHLGNSCKALAIKRTFEAFTVA